MEIESATGNGRSTTEPTTTKWCIQSPAAEKWAGGEESPAYLVWEDLTVVLPNYGNGRSKRLLQDLNGYAEPGKILAIMGPSGSGKSTLLDSLAGRLAKNVVLSGKVLVNGKKRRMAYGAVAYVTQENVFLGTLTVRETITYSANLRLSSQMSSEERRGVVETTITEMGLHDCAERQIGNWHIRGISGGEKKRLSIALEILTRPRLLFLDEPTSGLDSASAFIVIQTLRSLACGGRTVVSSIHQPSSEVFALFDGLFLLSGGEAVYFGDARSATDVKCLIFSLAFYLQIMGIIILLPPYLAMADGKIWSLFGWLGLSVLSCSNPERRASKARSSVHSSRAGTRRWPTKQG